MHGEVDPQSLMFYCFSVKSRIPTDHPLHPEKKLADSTLSALLEIRTCKNAMHLPDIDVALERKQ